MIAVISSRDVGSKCWSAYRFTGACYRCDRYQVCNLPVRIANAPYDAVRERARVLKAESDMLYASLKAHERFRVDIG